MQVELHNCTVGCHSAQGNAVSAWDAESRVLLLHCKVYVHSIPPSTAGYPVLAASAGAHVELQGRCTVSCTGYAELLWADGEGSRVTSSRETELEGTTKSGTSEGGVVDIKV